MSVEQAERALQAAQSEKEDAEARRDRLREEIEETGQRVERLEEAKADALAAGDDDRLQELREKRQEAERDLDELRGELPMIDDVITRRKKAVDEAELELVEARRAQLREEAEALGDEIREHLQEVAELWDDLEAVISTDRRQANRRSVLSERVVTDGGQGRFAKNAAGFSGHTDLLEEIASYMERVERESVGV